MAEWLSVTLSCTTSKQDVWRSTKCPPAPSQSAWGCKQTHQPLFTQFFGDDGAGEETGTDILYRRELTAAIEACAASQEQATCESQEQGADVSRLKDNTGQFNATRIALKLGHNLRKLDAVKQWSCIKMDNSSTLQDTKYILQCMDAEWQM